jgi:hypothetical protein
LSERALLIFDCIKGEYASLIALTGLKPHYHNVAGNGRRDGAKAEKSVRMTYAEIKPVYRG